MTKLPNTIKSSKGFTLIELLVVIAIIGILAGALFVAINPGARIRQANISAAEQAVTGYASNIEAYAADPTKGAGVYPGGTDASVAGPQPADNGTFVYTYQAMADSGSTTCTGTAGTGNCTRFAFRVVIPDPAGSATPKRFIYDSGIGGTCIVSVSTVHC